MNWIFFLILVGLWVQIQGLVTTIYLHRGLAHRAILIHPQLDRLMRTILWLGTDIVPKEWVAVHRKHHAYPDVEGDPHSPIIEGLPRVMLFNSMLYTKEARNPATLARFAQDIELGYMDIHRKRGMAMVWAVMIPLLGLAFGPWGLLAGLLFPVAALITYIFMSACINGLAHAWGYKNDPNSVAYNIRLLAVFTGGEGLHNNHHWRQVNAKFSQKWSEPDPGWLIIRLLARLGLVHITRAQKMIVRAA